MLQILREAKARTRLFTFADVLKRLLTERGVHLPAAQWDDKYLIGFFSGATLVHINVSTRGKLAIEKYSGMQADAWEHLTNLPGDLFRSRWLSLGQAKDESYLDGRRWGTYFAGLVTRSLKLDTAELRAYLKAGRIEAAALRTLSGARNVRDDGQLAAAAHIFEDRLLQHIYQQILASREKPVAAADTSERPRPLQKAHTLRAFAFQTSKAKSSSAVSSKGAKPGQAVKSDVRRLKLRRHVQAALPTGRF